MVRNLAHVVERENAKIGVFITLANPTAPMKTEAIKPDTMKVRIVAKRFHKGTITLSAVPLISMQRHVEGRCGTESGPLNVS